MDTRALADFIVQANRHTYAGNGPRANLLLPGSRQYEFAKGEYLYRDVYFGARRFQGQSVIYQKGSPVWGITYSGGIIHDQLRPEAEIYQFLKEALRLIPVEEPFRGPRQYTQGPLIYYNAPTGSLEYFNGVEEITVDKRSAYRLRYSGGLIIGED